MLHDQPRFAVVECDVVHGDRVLVGELGSDPALAESASADLLGGGRIEICGGDHLLDGHVPSESVVAGEPYGAHTSATELGIESITPGHQVIRTDDPSLSFLFCHLTRVIDPDGYLGRSTDRGAGGHLTAGAGIGSTEGVRKYVRIQFGLGHVFPVVGRS
jgi:hypothetical protein